MMLRPLAVVALCALASPAGAKGVRSGTTQRMTRTVTIDARMVITEWWSDGEDADTVHLVSYGASPPSGARFVLIDESGPYGAVIIGEVDTQLDYRGAPVYYDAIARWVDAPNRQQQGSVLALGPTTRAFPRARVVPAHGGQVDGEAPKSALSIWLTLDADGDRRADLTVARETCAGNALSLQQLGYYVDCFRAFSRDETGWKSLDSWHRIYEED